MRRLARKFNTLTSYWLARGASQKPAGGKPCAGSDKISTAILPGACGRFAFAGKTKTLNLETSESWKPTHKVFSGERVRERGYRPLPVVAIGSIPYIYRRAAFPRPGD